MELRENTGRVILLGAGCGRDLITLMGVEALASAEVVVYDDLIDDQLLDLVPESCERVYVGKRYGCHSKKQDEINQILIDKAKEGKTVVRLKGGDSFVFGRGGEEYLALEEEGIPCRLIPGVTSSVAVPENAGIPVTHRGVARSFTVITGHTADNTGENYDALAKLEGTLVFLMGKHEYANITARLIAAGKDPKTPAAVISKGFAPDQARVDGTLETIAEVSKDAPTPAILVIGQTAAYHMENKIRGVLDGTRVTVTGSGIFAGKMKRRLEKEGAYVDSIPTLKIEARTDAMPDSVEGYDWIVLTSSNGVELFFQQMREKHIDLRSLGNTRFACIGKGTADKLSTHGIFADFVPQVYTAQELGRALGEKINAEAAGTFAENENNGNAGSNAKARVLILRAANGSPLLDKELEAAGVEFTDIKLYDTVGLPIQKDVEAGYLVFASAGGVHSFFDAGKTIEANVIPVCIGDLTAKQLKERYDGHLLVAKDYTAEGLTQTIIEDVKKKG